MPDRLFSNIVSIAEIVARRHEFGRLICTSGGFDPLHAGHISSFFNSKKMGGTLIVLVNDDDFLVRKKGYRLMPQLLRCQIVSAIKWVDFALPINNKGTDQTVTEELQLIRPDYFTKGGDRFNKETIPEWAICQQLGISIITQTDDVLHRNSSSSIVDELLTKKRGKGYVNNQ